MKPITAEWVSLAEGDFATSLRELKVRKWPNYHGVCFHCQQCVEKYLKARLQEADIRFPKTHDLLELLDLVLPVEPMWEALRGGLVEVNDYAVEVRYPGTPVEKEEARRAAKSCSEIRRHVRESLGLKD
jgi:HEPN domain-containing protein